MPFVKGQSGNPAGRPVGSRNRFTQEMDEALQERGLPLIDAIAAHAHDANPAAMRLCLERLVPARKHRHFEIQLPSLERPDYTLAALGEVQRALGNAEITTEEATRLLAFIERATRIRALNALGEIDFADRLARCEQALALNGGKGAAPEESRPAARPAQAPEVLAEAAIDNNNAKTMAEPAASAGEAVQPSESAPAEPPPDASNN